MYKRQLQPRPPRDCFPNPLANLYRCRDGRWLMLVVLNEARQFEPLAQALDCAEIVDARGAIVALGQGTFRLILAKGA